MAIIIIIAIIGLWGLGVFLGVIEGFSKTFTNTPKGGIDSTVVKDQEHQTIEDTDEKQKQLMEDMKQKMEDERSQNPSGGF